ncbi:MAG: beta-propeller domain-containing protein [Candidatus Izemoplasmataceae bacterium]
MLFLFNNPLLLIGLLLILTLMFLLGKQMVKEIHYNHLLAHKKRALRYYDGDVPTNKRLYMIGSLALAPVLVIGLFLGIRLSADDAFVDDQFLQISNGQQIVELQKDFREKYLTSYRNYLFGFAMMEDDFTAVPETDASEDAGGEGSDDYSDTNNQVEGVDEMDNVVTDGKFIYTIQQNKIVITLAYTLEDEYDVLGHYKTITYEDSFNPTGLYIDDDYLVVIGYDYMQYDERQNDDVGLPEGDYYYGYYYQSQVGVKVYDVKNDYTIDHSYLFEGNMIGTRKIEDQLIIITSNYLPYSEEEKINMDEYLPTYYVDEQEFVADYEDVRYIEGSNPNVFLTFYSLNLGTKEVDQSILLGDSAYNLYVSNDNIYLVGSVYMFSPLADVVNLEDPITETKTAIIKLSIDEYDLTFRNLAHIEGFTLNQFSMDEYQGYLRITTTTSRWRFGDGEINNRLYILDEELNIVSELENLGKPGETIQSTRFVGEYAYLITFEQTDPFYVINVADPENPFVEGELEIPGFSAYLQPFGQDFMLGIGFGDSKGGTQGVKISLYDIRDKTNPLVHDEIIFEYSEFGFAYTSVTYNHKDLLLSYAKGLIALPFTSYDDSSESGQYYNSGIMVFHIDDEGMFSFGGFVQHEEDSEENIYVYKSKFIDQYLYTVSNKYIKVSTIEDPLGILNSTEIE